MSVIKVLVVILRDARISRMKPPGQVAGAAKQGMMIPLGPARQALCNAFPVEGRVVRVTEPFHGNAQVFKILKVALNCLAGQVRSAVYLSYHIGFLCLFELL